jgi:hypothetical protein
MRTTTALTLGTAAKAVGRSKSTVLRAIRDGKLTAAKGDDGQYAIEPAELFRVFDPEPDGTVPENADDTPRNPMWNASGTGGTQAQPLIDELRRQLGELKDDRERERGQLEATVNDLRRRLDEVRATEQRLLGVIEQQAEHVKLLTDQRTPPAAMKEEPARSRGVWAWLMGR